MTFRQWIENISPDDLWRSPGPTTAFIYWEKNGKDHFFTGTTHHYIWEDYIHGNIEPIDPEIKEKWLNRYGKEFYTTLREWLIENGFLLGRIGSDELHDNQKYGTMVSFWNNKNLSQLKNCIEYLLKNNHIDYQDWIMSPVFRPIKVQNYLFKNRIKTHPSNISNELIGKAHVMSPIEKEKQGIRMPGGKIQSWQGKPELRHWAPTSEGLDFKQEIFELELPRIKEELQARKEKLLYIANPNAKWWYKHFDEIENKIIEKLWLNWGDQFLHTSGGRKSLITQEFSNALQNGLISRRSHEHLKNNHGLHIDSLFNTINKATKKPWTIDEIRAVLKMPKEYRKGTFNKGWTFPN